MIVTLAAFDINAAAESVLIWLGLALLTGTLLAGLTWLLTRPVEARLRPGIVVALWVIVLIKFLVPIGPAWSLSLASIWRAAAPYSAESLAASNATPPGEMDSLAAPLAGGAQSAGTTAMQSWSWKTFLAAAYVITVVVLMIVRAGSYHTFRVKSAALPPANELTHELVRSVCRRLRVTRVPRVRIDDRAPAPFVMGFFRPLLVLSRRQLVRPDELETVIVHEVTHLRRGDMFVRLLQWIAGTLLFFWPVVAWVNRRIDRASEHACDEWALSHGRLTAGQYARCLLEAVQPLRTRPLAYRPICMADRHSNLERRINVILGATSRPRRRRIGGLLAAAFVLVWGGFTLTGAADEEKKAKAKKTKYAPTEASMRAHAAEVYALVNEYSAGDMNGDGKVSKEECWAFVTALALQDPDAVLDEYPTADSNRDGKLEFSEAYLFVRGDAVIKKVQKKMQPRIENASKDGNRELVKKLKEKTYAAEMDGWHQILSRREALLNMIDAKPTAELVEGVAKKMKKLDGAAKQKDKLWTAIGEIHDLKKKAAELRAKAKKLEGEEADAYRSKGKQLEQKAADLSAKVTSVLKEEIAKAEDAGDTKKVQKLKQTLAELD